MKGAWEMINKIYMKILINCFMIVGISLPMLYVAQPVFANDSPLELILDKKTNEEKTAHIQLITQAKFDLVELIIPDGTEINKEKTLVQNVGEIKSIKKVNGKIQIKLINDDETNKKIELYLNKDKSFKQGSIEAVVEDNIYSNKIVLRSSIQEQAATFEILDDTWHEITGDTAEIKKGGNTVKVTKGTSNDLTSGRFSITNTETNATFPELRLSADLIIDDNLLQTDGLPLKETDNIVDMYNSQRKSDERIAINTAKDKILLEFTVDKMYFVQVEIEPKSSGDVVKRYTITNKSGSPKKIGLSEITNTISHNGSYNLDVSIPSTNDRVSSGMKGEAKVPYFQWQQGDFENWMVGVHMENLTGYIPPDSSGNGAERPNVAIDWKNGKWEEITDNISDSEPIIGQFLGKKRGVTLENNQTTKISNVIKLKESSKPVLSFEKNKFIMINGESTIQIDSTTCNQISDTYSLFYKDDQDGKTVLAKSFNEQRGETGPLTANVGKLTAGRHTGSFYLADDEGLVSVESVPVTLDVLTEEDEWTEVETDEAEIQVGANYVKVNKNSNGLSIRPVIGAQAGGIFPQIVFSGDLIIEDKLIETDEQTHSAQKVDMFEKRRKSNEVRYINKNQDRIMQTFTVDSKYYIEVLFELKASGDIVKKYSITNKSGSSKKIGLSELSQVYQDSYFTDFIPYESNSILIKYEQGNRGKPFIEWEQGDFENWTYGSDSRDFNRYMPKNAMGEGLENVESNIEKKGKWFREYDKHKIAAKTVGTNLHDNETIKIANKINIRPLVSPPQLTLEKTDFTVGKGQSKIKLNGTVYDKERSAYQLFYFDQTDNKTVLLESYNEPAGKKVTIEDLTVNLGDLSIGKHTGNFYVLNDYGLRNEVNIPAEITVIDNLGNPIIQKVKVDDPFDKNLNELFSDIADDGVTMTHLEKPDTSKIGFTTANATLENKQGIKLDVEIPVNVYDEETTTFYDKEKIAVDGTKEASFTVGELDVSEDWQALIKEKIKLKSWDMETGKTFETELKEDNLQSVPGTYKASFSINKKDQPIIYDVVLRVSGYLKFEQVPDFDYGTAEIPKNRTILSRAGDDQIIINDERGANNNWRLTAVLTKETDRKFGNLLFVNADNQEQRLEVNERILIKEAQTEKTALQPLGWLEKTGLLFEISPGSYSGKYSGNIEWSLEDVPMK